MEGEPDTYLHQNIIINSQQQKSAQGSVFYVKIAADLAQELVLKIYKKEDIKSYLKETAVFKKIMDIKNAIKDNKVIATHIADGVCGFPDMISHIEGQQKAEILMEALGPNLRKLLK